jgi:glycosyltransferase involved in cell wall biosynthesis
MTETVSATVPWLVISDDWGRHPTSCQHLIRHLLPEQPVTWVNMIGTRRPRLDRATVRRGWEKLGQWFRPTQTQGALPANLQIVSPKVWPGFRSRWERKLNRALVGRQLRRAIDELPEAPIAIATMPTAADLVGRLPVRKWVYYCVDDFSAWPGIDQAAARRLEDRFIDRADVLIAVGETLMDRIERRGRKAHLLTHGVDLEFWANQQVTRSKRSRTVLFWGLIDRRMDVDFLRALSTSLSDGGIVLLGPQDNPDPAIQSLGNVECRPSVPLVELPALAAQADVLIMPYVDAPVTRAMQPLKLKEYLATGKPIVVRDLPANREWADALDLAATPTEFAQAVLARLAGGLPADQLEARRRLADESWSAKARQFSQFVSGVV